jgi:hypothetical protein
MKLSQLEPIFLFVCLLLTNSITTTLAFSITHNLDPNTNSFSTTTSSSSTSPRTFQHSTYQKQNPISLKSSYSYNNNNNNTNNNNNNNPDPNNNKDDDTNTLKANRFSKFAPDANLPADEFRAQLKENMKRDLEERRRNDPNRGNQPAKSYLDSL